MKRERDTPASPSNEAPSTPRDNAPLSALEPSDPIPDPEPSDPDAAMYAAIAARPNWLEKPKVKQLIQELSEGLGPGEDLFYWDMRRRRRPRPAQPSDAEEHCIVPVRPSAAELTETLPSARVIVLEPHPPRPSPGRNGPRQPSNSAPEPGAGLSRPPSHPPPPVHLPRWCLAACFFALVLMAAALTLVALQLGTSSRAQGPTPPTVVPPARGR